MGKVLDCFKKKEISFLIVTIMLIVTQVYLDLKLPDYMSEITTLVQTEGSTMSDILTAGFFMLACSLGSLTLTIIVGFFVAQIATTVSKRLREKVYDKTISFSMTDINNFTTGSLITRTTNDITQIQTFIAMGYTALVRAPLMAVWAIIKILNKNTTFTVVTAVAVASLIFVLSIVLTLAVPKTKKIQILIDKLNTVVREHLTGVRVVRAYNAEEYQEEKFEKTNTDVRKTQLFINRSTALMSPFMTFLMSSLTLVIYWVGAYLINEAGMLDKIQIFSDMVVFTSYAMQIIMSFMMLTMIFMITPRVLVSLGRIKEVLNFENKIVDGTVTKSDNKTDVAIEFKNVSFTYTESEEMVLENVSFKVNKGETIAFIGSTGSGKSTIVNLILRFYDCTKGEILIDGVNVKDYTQKALREKLGLVSQKALLFSGDVKSNIAYGKKDIEMDRIKVAVNVSQATDFVSQIGVDGEISQGGINLSGGQKQRISIARAVYNTPEIYILDDCFSALDYKTDRMLRNELNEQTKGSTKLIVAQRISTVKDADVIVVLDDGKVAAMGKHKELLSSSAIYMEIAKSQLSKEEIDHE